MHPSSAPLESQSSSSTGGTTTRAAPTFDDTAQPSLTSGFGAVMEQEENIRASTERCLAANSGPHAAEIERLLQHQRTQLSANIALLEQRYEMLPHAARFNALHEEHPRLSVRHDPTLADSGDVLPGLIAQHLSLLRNIETLIGERPDGQRGELILSEIARNHEEMAWMLTALHKEDLAAAKIADGGFQPPSPNPAEERWDNEGGSANATSQPS